MSKARAYLELIRLPNVFTAIADVTAGFLYMGGEWSDAKALALLGGASACLYAGGVALNDVCDAKRDAIHRPERPIPSGRISRGTAAALALSLLLVGVIVAAFWSGAAAALAGGIVVAVILYDAVLKTTFLAPPLMGACRGLNLALGMTVIPTYRTIFGIIPVLFYHALYVASVTYFARKEAEGGHRTRLLIGTIGIGFAVAGLGGLCVLVPRPHYTYLILLAILFMLVVSKGVAAIRRPEPASIQNAVRTFIQSLVVFDTCIAWAARGPIAAVAVVAWVLPTRLARRWSQMT